jgi:MFS family permease
VLALLYLKVRDYRTVELAPALQAKRQSLGEAVVHIVKVLARSRTMLWVCIGGSAQLIVVSAMWSWLPSFLNRVHGIEPGQAALKAALVVLAGAAGAVVWGAVVDRAGARQPRRKLMMLALLCLVSLAVLMTAFGVPLQAGMQFPLILVGGFLMTCSVGPVSAIVIDVIHPGVRATGSSVLALFQNLFGLAAGPFIAGVLSDVLGLTTALTVMPAFAVLAAAAFLLAARSYEADKASAGEAALAPAGLRPRWPETLNRLPRKPMNGMMMQQPLLISSLLIHAERHHGDQEIVSRRVEGDLHRCTYRDLAGARAAWRTRWRRRWRCRLARGWPRWPGTATATWSCTTR